MSRATAKALSASTYVPHVLHKEGQAWIEKNCYIDVWIEAVHAQGLEPLAMMPFTVTSDFEGDQWSFFKPPHSDLWDLYGVVVHELNVWRPLSEHAVNHAKLGNFVFTEADSFYLPDTSGTDYRRNHVKSTIVINDVDFDAKKLGYFHNAGYYELSGEDFDAQLRVGVPHDPTFLPLFAEFARFDRMKRLAPRDLASVTKSLFTRHLAARPLENPVAKYRGKLMEDLEVCKAEGLAFYHQYAFATLRQCGAGFELTGRCLEWLGANGEAGLEDAAKSFDTISQTAKAMILKGARAVNAKRAVDLGEMLDTMQTSWDAGMKALLDRFGG